MATRTLKLMGKAYSTSGDVSIAVNFNNTQVFNGIVPTVDASAPGDKETPVELATWTVDTSVTGSVPLSITVSNGTFDFTNIAGNYCGYVLQETDGVPDIVDGQYVVLTTPSDHFDDLNINSLESDGKNNVVFTNITGDAPVRNPVDESETGDWTYRIDDGATFSCDFALDADKIILEVPAPPA